MQQTGPHSYKEAGQGPVLVCLHGIGGDDRGFVDQITALAPTCRIIAWNMPGYRNSAAIDPVTFNGLTAALTDFLDRLQISRATLIGHSIGGMLAQEAALALPDRITRLVLIGTTPAFG